MIDPADDLTGGGASVPFAGYTYFGQFVDHDLTRNSRSLTALRSAALKAATLFSSVQGSRFSFMLSLARDVIR